jgi:hypothetical protein
MVGNFGSAVTLAETLDCRARPFTNFLKQNNMTTELDKLHNDIMNLPCGKVPPFPFSSGQCASQELRAYKEGHRDARHAAAELVSAFSPDHEHPNLSNTLSTMLWLYRRLPAGYGRPPFVEADIISLANEVGQDVSEFLAERT